MSAKDEALDTDCKSLTDCTSLAVLDASDLQTNSAEDRKIELSPSSLFRSELLPLRPVLQHHLSHYLSQVGIHTFETAKLSIFGLV